MNIHKFILCVYICAGFSVCGYSQILEKAAQAGTTLVKTGKQLANVRAATNIGKTVTTLSSLQPKIAAAAQAQLTISSAALPKPPVAFADEKFPMADAVFDRIFPSELRTLYAPKEFSALAHAYQIAPKNGTSLLHAFSQDANRLRKLPQPSATYDSLEAQMFDVLIALGKDLERPESSLLKFDLQTMVQEFVKLSAAARMRWPEIWAEVSLDTTRWEFVEMNEVLVPFEIPFQPDLVVVVINDDEEVVRQAVKQLKPYAGHIFWAYNLQEVILINNLLKQQNLHPHYVISDGMLGRHITDLDIKRTIKNAFPEIAETLGFVLVSDGVLSRYAKRRGYVSSVTRDDDYFHLDLGNLISYLEANYHIKQTIDAAYAPAQPEPKEK